MTDKGVSLTITIKDVAIESDNDFNSLLDETLASVKDKLVSARTQASQSKAPEIGGVVSLAEKGVGISLTFDF